MARKKYLPAIVVAILGFAIGIVVFYHRGEPKQPIQRPNILLIVADDLGYGDLGCYGSKDIRTPHLDGLANRGVRLTDYYANACVCSPTRAALISGRYPQRYGFDWVVRYTERDRGLLPEKTSLPRMLKDAGFRTALYGKWHLGYADEFSPNAHGFDDFFGFLGSDLDYYSHRDEAGAPGLYENRKRVEEKGYLTDLITRRAVDFLDKNAKEPFFLEVAYNAPHWPFQPPNRPDDVRDPRTYGPEVGTREDYVKIVERLDDGVGQILQALEKNGATKSTLVVFFSDNGGERLSSNAPFFHGKYTLWEGGIRVPCIMSWPEVLPEAKVSAQPVITTDLTASMLAAAQVALPANAPLDGEDVLPVLSGQKPERQRTFCWRLPRPDERFGQKAIRRGKWKYIEDRGMGLLFDLEADPSERRNLAYQHPQLVNELRLALALWEFDVMPMQFRQRVEEHIKPPAPNP
jgi:arylsulfatase A